MSGQAPAALPDSATRRRAATDFSQNLVVLAGAGTGKTSLLVERVLCAVGSGALDIGRLAAITFTEKAAGEMRERLAAGLDGLRALARGEIEPDPAAAPSRAFVWLRDEAGVTAETLAARALRAMEAMDTARVSTIHSFCAEVLREHPVEAGVDPDFAVDTGGALAARRDEAWEAFLARELGPEAPRAALWSEVLGRFAPGAVREVAFGLAGFKVPRALLTPPHVVPDAREILEAEVTAEIVALDDLLPRETGMTPPARQFFVEARETLDAFRREGLDGLRRVAGARHEICRRLHKGNPPDPNMKLAGVTPEEMKQVGTASLRLIQRLHNEVDDGLLALVVEATAPFALEFRESFLRAGFVDFDGLIGLTRDLLRDDPAVRRSQKQRFRMVLVDEFQDTDPVQHEIVLLLGEAIDEAACDPWAAVLAPGRLFVVGDAKQSIYRFRGADYSSYRRAVARIAASGGEVLDLSANFRSVPGIVEPLNRPFAPEAGLWRESAYQPAYVPIDAVRPASDEDPAVEVLTVELPDGALADERREAEGRVLAETIERTVEQGRCAWRDVTVLFRAFTNIGYYLRPLRERGIPFVVDGGREFLQRPEVGQLIAALRTLSQPADGPALLAFLRSPAGAVSDRDLAAYAAERPAWDWRDRPDPARHPAIGRAFSILRDLWEETRWLPADAVVRRVLDRTLLLPLSAVAYEGPQRVANLRKLAASAAELARDGNLSLEEVVEALELGRLEDIETDRPLSDDAAEAVRITSIHRMKGLENAWVFLPDLARQDARARGEEDGAAPVRLADGREALAIRISKTCNSVRVLEERERRRHEEAEELRVLYVALSRARERLVLLVGPGRGPRRWVDALGAWGYDRELPPADGARLDEGRVLHRRVNVPAAFRPKIVRLPEGAAQAVEDWGAARDAARALAIPPLAAPSGIEETARDVEIRQGGASRDLGRAVGIVLHRLLERWPAEDGALGALCVEAAEIEGVERAALVAACRPIVETFRRSELSRRLESVEVLGRELPMLSRRADGTALRGSIDLVYRDADGAIVVADYKTDRDADVDALRERYGPQLAAYSDAVARAWNLKGVPRAELWLLRSGERVALDPQ